MIQRKQSSIPSLTGLGWNFDFTFSHGIRVGVLSSTWGMVPRVYDFPGAHRNVLRPEKKLMSHN